MSAAGSMHGKKFVVQEVHFGSDGRNFFVRIDFHSGLRAGTGSEWKRGCAGQIARSASRASEFTMDFATACASPVEWRWPMPAAGTVECGVMRGCSRCAFRWRLWAWRAAADCDSSASLWQGGLPIDAVPQQGWIEMKTTDPARFEG